MEYHVCLVSLPYVLDYWNSDLFKNPKNLNALQQRIWSIWKLQPFPGDSQVLVITPKYPQSLDYLLLWCILNRSETESLWTDHIQHCSTYKMNKWTEIKNRILFSYMGCDWTSISVDKKEPRRVWQPNPWPFFKLRMKSYFDPLVKILKTLGL